MLLAPTLISSQDTDLGRVDLFSLTQQQLMELLVSGLKDKDSIFESEFPPPDACTWSKVECDSKRDVRAIRWARRELRGSIDLQFLPLRLEYLDIGRNHLKGSIDVGNLPPQMFYVSFTQNNFLGTVDLTKFSVFLDNFDCAANVLSGSLDLTKLPAGMRSLALSMNRFTGSVDLTALPACLEALYLDGNRLCGKLDLGALPLGLQLLDLENNDFEEILNFNACSGLEVNIEGNALSDEVLHALNLSIS